MTKKKKTAKDAIKTIYERMGFKKFVEDNSDTIADATLHLWKAYEQLYDGKPSPDNIKGLLKKLLKNSETWLKFILDPDLTLDETTINTISERFVEDAYSSAIETIKKRAYFKNNNANDR